MQLDTAEAAAHQPYRRYTLQLTPPPSAVIFDKTPKISDAGSNGDDLDGRDLGNDLEVLLHRRDKDQPTSNIGQQPREEQPAPNPFTSRLEMRMSSKDAPALGNDLRPTSVGRGASWLTPASPPAALLGNEERARPTTANIDAGANVTTARKRGDGWLSRLLDDGRHVPTQTTVMMVLHRHATCARDVTLSLRDPSERLLVIQREP